jgi:hypothetical protein
MAGRRCAGTAAVRWNVAFDNPEDIDFRERRRGRLGMQAIASRKTRSAIGEVAHLERAELRYG